ncbi:MAG: rhamnulose-1-phosphate aldolase [Bacteroidetes bacterium]|nr:rhamnulose-1-phosphate aldolase [Bacteroidota bacterium]
MKRYGNEKLNNIISEIAETGEMLWTKDWAERNAGNISVNIEDCIDSNVKKELSGFQVSCFDLDKSYPGIAGHHFIVTGTGKRMRDLAKDPDKNSIIIRINNDGKRYEILSPADSDSPVFPTSELPTHLAIHEHMGITGSPEKALLHTHPTELIALTQIKDFCNEEALNHLLWQMHPETIMMVPEGAGFIPYILPGTNEIADSTLMKFKDHKIVLWEKHGCLAIGKDVVEAFDLIDLVAKSARIYFLCKMAGHSPQGFSASQLAELKELGKKFLS